MMLRWISLVPGVDPGRLARTQKSIQPMTDATGIAVGCCRSSACAPSRLAAARCMFKSSSDQKILFRLASTPTNRERHRLPIRRVAVL